MTDSALPALDWHDLGTPHGKGFTDTLRPYDRLPGRAEALVPEAVWDLSRMASGLFTRVRTDTTTIAVRYTLGLPELGMTHMPPTSVSGIDLYADTPDGTTSSRWVAVSHPATFPEVEALLVDGIDAGTRDYTLWFPLFNRVESAEIGLTPGASFTLLPEDETPPIVYYGTSIIHGASASRPGMTVTAQLSRRLGRRVLGLGFSGNGKMEVELADLLAEIPGPPAVYVIDCLPNMDADLVTERALPFLEALRAKRPDTPILLVEDRTLENAWVYAVEREKHDARRRELRAAYDAMRERGDTRITLVSSDGLLGTDGDATVDRSHPTDLGFHRQADVLEPVLRRLLDHE